MTVRQAPRTCWGRTRTAATTPSSPTAISAVRVRSPRSGTLTWSTRRTARGGRSALPSGPRTDEDGKTYGNLGRETFLASVTWEDGWPVVNAGVRHCCATCNPLSRLRPHRLERCATTSTDPRWAGVEVRPRARPTSTWTEVAWPSRSRTATIGEVSSPAFVCRPQDSWTFNARTVARRRAGRPYEAAGICLRQNDDFSLQLLVIRAEDGSRVARAITHSHGVDEVLAERKVPDGSVELGRARA